MKEKRLPKKLIVCLLIGLLAVLMAVPVSAASTKTKYKDIKKGQCYHILNTNISKNKISKYVISVEPKTSGAKYDLAIAYVDNEGLTQENIVKNYTKKITNLTNNSKGVLKNNSSDNSGMIACIKVTQGTVRFKVKYTSSYKNAALSFKRMGSSHQPLKGLTIKKGKSVTFKRGGGNVDMMPIIAASTNGAVTRRPLVSVGGISAYDELQFKSNTIKYRIVMDGEEQYNATARYDNKVGSKGYSMIPWLKEFGNSCKFTNKKGTVNYYYPTDYLKISVKK